MSILGITPESRPPFQGDSVVRLVPRAEALGYSLFALRAMTTSPNCSPRAETGLKTPGYSLFGLRAMAKCPNSRA